MHSVHILPMHMVIGIDGGTWSSFDQFSEKMPFLSSMKAKGCRGVLRSVMPTGSAAAWTSFATGKNPGKHGIISWEIKPFSEKIAGTGDIREMEIWDIISSNGLRVGVMCPPISFPPKHVNGFYVSGIGRPSINENMILPEEDAARARDMLEDMNTIEYMKENGRDATREKIAAMTVKKTDFFIEMMRKYSPEFGFILLDENDRFQHFFWDDPEALGDYYSVLDASLQKIYDEFPSANFFIISDHGFHAAPKKYFHINTWLMENGYIKVGLFERIKILLYPLGKKLLGWLAKEGEVPAWMKRFVPHQENIIKNIQEKPDFLGFNNFSLFVRNKEHIIEIRDKLKLVLDQGIPVFREVNIKTEAYTGALADNMPEIVFLMNENYAINTNFSTSIISPAGTAVWKGYHTFAPEGIMLCFGPDIKESMHLDASIMDIAPTILHNMEVPVPRDCDGKVLYDMLKENKQTRYFDSLKPEGSTDMEKGEEELVKKKLRDLGYM